MVRKHRNFFLVEHGLSEILCSLSSKLRKDLAYPEADTSSRRRRVDTVRDVAVADPVVVGDEVRVEPGQGVSLIVERLPRRSVLAREAPSRTHLQQVIAANVDQVLAVASTQAPPFRADILDRILAGCEHHRLQAVVCLTKTDLGIPPDVETMLSVYPSLGYPVVRTSAETREGLEEAGQVLRGKNSVAIGLSGTGKSSLINALVPGRDIAVHEVNRKTGLGVHTTSTVWLHRLPFGGHVVDAPGLRELGLWDCPGDGVASLFPEIRDRDGACRFRGCAHRDEPGCAVKDAVETNDIAQHRYRNYLNIRREVETRKKQY